MTGESSTQPLTGTVKINYVPGYAINIWKTAGNGGSTGKQLRHGTQWRVYQRAVVNGHTWYNLGGSQWLDGTYAKLVKENARGAKHYTNYGEAAPDEDASGAIIPEITVIAKTWDGKVLQKRTFQSKIAKVETVMAPDIPGYTLDGDRSVTFTAAIEGREIVFNYEKNDTPVEPSNPDQPSNPNQPSDHSVNTAIVRDEIVRLLNQYRQSKGVPALSVNADLTAGAAVRAQQEANAADSAGNLSAGDHQLPDGQAFNNEAHLKQYGGWAMGENLAFNYSASSDQALAAAIMTQWKNSPGHNENMLDTDFSDVGVSVAVTKSGAVCAIQDFGNR